MPEIVGIFGSKGDALAGVDELYALGNSDTEIEFLDRKPAVEAGAGRRSRVASAMYASGALNSYRDETG